MMDSSEAQNESGVREHEDGTIDWAMGDLLSPSAGTKPSMCAGAAVELGPGDAYYSYRMRGGDGEIRIATDKRKGLAFQLWPSALALTAYLEARHAETPGVWRGKRAVELGAGCGLVGIVLAALGAHVTLTDLESVLPMLRENMELNREAIVRAGGSAECTTLAWGQPLPPDFCSSRPDLIVAADVIYHKVLFDPLLSTLRELTREGDELLMAHVRRWKTDSLFFKKAKRRFAIELLPLAGTSTSTDQAKEERRRAGGKEVAPAHGAGEHSEGQRLHLGGKGSQLLLRLVRKSDTA